MAFDHFDEGDRPPKKFQTDTQLVMNADQTNSDNELSMTLADTPKISNYEHF